MKFLVIGLGSMGKRRIRNLYALGYRDVIGFDCRSDRREEAEVRYGIKSYADFFLALEKEKIDALIIATPPDTHREYMDVAIKRGLHFFVELSIVDTELLSLGMEAKKRQIIAAPSASLLFHPAIKIIARVLKSGDLGKVSNVLVHAGQYLRDWHPYEDVSEFFVSNPITGGAREIASVELKWISGIFGFPERVCGIIGKTIDIPGAGLIDDTYNFLLDYNNFFISITTDAVSRCAMRRVLINGSEKQLLWEWNHDYVQIYDPVVSMWKEIAYEIGTVDKTYHTSIGEAMYIDELKNFIDAIVRKETFVNTMENDQNTLDLLYAIEEASKTSNYMKFKARDFYV